MKIKFEEKFNYWQLFKRDAVLYRGVLNEDTLAFGKSYDEGETFHYFSLGSFCQKEKATSFDGKDKTIIK